MAKVPKVSLLFPNDEWMYDLQSNWIILNYMYSALLLLKHTMCKHLNLRRISLSICTSPAERLSVIPEMTEYHLTIM